MTDVIAFDIDGVLTSTHGIREFNDLQEEDNVVGIVSARSREGIISFIVENNLDPDFIRSSKLKGMELRQIRDSRTGDNYIYYGSWLRDRIHAVVAMWEYRQI